MFLLEIEIWQDNQGRSTVYENVKKMDIENLSWGTLISCCLLAWSIHGDSPWVSF